MAVAEPELAAEGDHQPAEFPIDFEEWAAGQNGYMSALVAGYRHRVRATGSLRGRKTRSDWDKGFKVFRSEPA